MPLISGRLYFLNNVKIANKKLPHNDKDSILPDIIGLTQEICTSKEDLDRKLAIYKFPIWTCRVTSKTGLTFEQAFKSEQKFHSDFKKSIPIYFAKSILQFVHQSVDTLENICIAIHRQWEEQLVNGERVFVHVDNQKFEGLVCSAVKSKTRVSEAKSGASNGSPAASSDKENRCESSCKTILDLGKMNNFRSSTSQLDPSIHYTIKIPNLEISTNGVPAGALTRCDGPLPSKPTIKTFIRTYACRFPLPNRPWIVDENMLRKHHISDPDKSLFVDIEKCRESQKKMEVDIIQSLKKIDSFGEETPEGTDKQMLNLIDQSKQQRRVNNALKIIINNFPVITPNFVSGSSNHDLFSILDELNDSIEPLNKKQKMDNEPVVEKPFPKTLKQTTLFDIDKLKSSKTKFKTPLTSPTVKIASQHPSITRLQVYFTKEVQSTNVTEKSKLRGLTQGCIHNCVRVLTQSQIDRIEPPELRERVLLIQNMIAERNLMKTMTPEERKEYFKKKRQNSMLKKKEFKEDSDLVECNGPLPDFHRLSSDNSIATLSANSFRDLLEVSEFMCSMRHMLIPGKSSSHLYSSIKDGFFGLRLLNEMHSPDAYALTQSIFVALMHTILHDDCFKKMHVLGIDLSRVPVTAGTVLELVRLLMSNQVRKNLIQIDSQLLSTFQETELNQLSSCDKLTLLTALVSCCLRTDQLEAYQESCIEKRKEFYNKKIDRHKQHKDSLKQLRTSIDTNPEPTPNATSRSFLLMEKNRLRKSESMVLSAERGLQQVERLFMQIQKEAEFALRIMPLGYDRLNRRYWRLHSFVGCVFIEATSVASSDVEEIDWSVLCSESELDSLMAVLNVKGEKESILLKKLKHVESDLRKEMIRIPAVLAQSSYASSYFPVMKPAENQLNNGSNVVAVDTPSEDNDSKPGEPEYSTPIDRRFSFRKRSLRLDNGRSEDPLRSTDFKKTNYLVDSIFNLKKDIVDFEIRLRSCGLGGVRNYEEWTQTLESDISFDSLRDSLLMTGSAILIRFLHIPSGIKTCEGEFFVDNDSDEITPDGQVEEEKKNIVKVDATMWIAQWKEQIIQCKTLSRLSVLLAVLENVVSWEKSVERAKCRICKIGDDDGVMLLCDGCNDAYHLYCLRPALKEVPADDWWCNKCRPSVKPTRKSESTSRNVLSDEESQASCESQFVMRRRSNRRANKFSSSSSSEKDSLSSSQPLKRNLRSVVSLRNFVKQKRNDPDCLLCEKPGDGSVDLILCSTCPNSFHRACHDPPIRAPPRLNNTWSCSDCRRNTKLRASKNKH